MVDFVKGVCLILDLKKLKYKNKNTTRIKEGYEIYDVLSIIACCGLISNRAFQLLGVSGRTRRNMLRNMEYVDSQNKIVFNGVAFKQYEVGICKYIRPEKKAYPIFDAVDGGEEYVKSFKDAVRYSDEEHLSRIVAYSELCAFALRAGVEFNPLKVPEIHNLGDSYEIKPTEIKQNILYSARKIRQIDDRAKKVARGCRAIGMLVDKKRANLCYNFLDSKKKRWQFGNEVAFITYLNFKFLVHNLGYEFDVRRKSNCVFLSESYEDSDVVIFNESFNIYAPDKYGVKSDVFCDLFEDVYVFPKNENGINSFKFYNQPDVILKLAMSNGLNDESIKYAYRSGYNCDAYDVGRKIAHLFFYTGCVTKLKDCINGSRPAYPGWDAVTLKIHCFPFQEAYVRGKIINGMNVEVEVCNYDEIVRKLEI